MNRPRVVLADDHDILLEGLRLILAEEAEVLGTAGDGLALVELVRQLRPEVAVVDISMPKLNGLDAFQQSKPLCPFTKFVFLTGNPDVQMATHAFRLGASGYVLKQSAADELVTAVRAAQLGQTYITPRIAGEVMRNLQSGETGVGAHLTARERQVLQLLAEGKSLKESAHLLNVSARTVEFHRNNLSDKTGLRTMAELARYAVRLGLVSEP